MITRPDDHTGSHIHYFAAFPYTSIWGGLEGRKTPEQGEGYCTWNVSC